MNTKTKSRQKEPTKGFKLEVPLDASGIEEVKGGEVIQVFAVAKGEEVQSQSVKISEKKMGNATFSFAEDPGQVKILLGPETASKENIEGLQTVSRTVSTRGLIKEGLLRLEAIVIPPYYWYWWRRWCRTFTIRGRVVCPDGSPVPGAKVCASDVDAFWWWTGLQQVGCDTTGADGTFEITFRWCCGWWPWWWWKLRNWRLEPVLVDRIIPELPRRPYPPIPPVTGPQPDLDYLTKLLPEFDATAGDLPRTKSTALPTQTTGFTKTATPQVGLSPAQIETRYLAAIGDKLKDRIKQPAGLRDLKLWPWYPWNPWNDCTPDIIFRVTQICQGVEKVIVDENYFDTRWNIPTTLDVTLVANDEACCIPDQGDEPVGDCMVISRVCSHLVDSIGGNPDAPPHPAGYNNPGTVETYGDRPFAGTVPISGLFGNAAGVDYYEFEWYDSSVGTWKAMPAAAAGGFSRPYWGFQIGGGPLGWHSAAFPFTTISGRNVIESREHFQANNDPASWGITRFWGGNYDLLMNWLTENTFPDGLYRLRVVAWDKDPGTGDLVNRRVLHLCNTDEENEVVIRLDNRIVGPGSGHPGSTADHPTGEGTVHIQTLEPDTDILSVKIIRADGTEAVLKPCGKTKINPTDKVRIDFLAHDPDGHLAYYTLHATYGENQIRNLLAFGAPIPLPAGGPPSPVPAAQQPGPTYKEARSPAQGALAPTWHGGALRLEIDALSAFPSTCCYQLELRAYKRTIVSCNGNYVHRNLSEYSFMVEV